MQARNFSLSAYLQRIGFTGEPRADLATLQSMMRRQLYSVPFENGDVWQGKIVSLEPESIVEKIVNGKRGGYCYEVNGLFCMALESIGIAYTMLAARPRYNYTERRPKTHMVLRVDMGSDFYLCDLGFGGYGLREPVNITRLPVEVEQGPDRFRVSRMNDLEYLLQVEMKGQWTDLYSFDLIPQEWIDYRLPNYFNSTSPDTIFTQKKLAILQNPTGRKFLIDNELKTLSPEGVKTERIPDDAFSNILAEHFGIRIS